jgi:hypothetical protein
MRVSMVLGHAVNGVTYTLSVYGSPAHPVEQSKRAYQEEGGLFAYSQAPTRILLAARTAVGEFASASIRQLGCIARLH